MKTMTSLGVLGLLAAVSASAQESPAQVFAKEAVPLEFRCGDAAATREMRWGEATLTLSCKGPGSDAPVQARYKMGIIEATIDLETDDPAWRPMEVLWFGNGKSFLVNGGSSATSGQTFVVFRNDGTELKRSDITAQARKAMHDRLVKCWSQIKKAPEFNDRGFSAFNMRGSRAKW